MNKYILNNNDMSKEIDEDLAMVYYDIKEQEKIEEEESKNNEEDERHSKK